MSAATDSAGLTDAAAKSSDTGAVDSKLATPTAALIIAGSSGSATATVTGGGGGGTAPSVATDKPKSTGAAAKKPNFNLMSALPPHLKLQILSILKQNPLEQPSAQPDSKSAAAAASGGVTATDATSAATSAAAAAAATKTADSEIEDIGPPPLVYSTTNIKSEHCLRLSPAQLTELQTAGYIICDGVLGADKCTALHADLTSSAANNKLMERLKPAGMKKGWKQSDTRGDTICWLHSDDTDLPPSLRHAMSVLDSYRTELNRSVDLKSEITHTQLALYSGGGARYVRHCDTYPGGPKRRLTVIYYVNPGWEKEHGGCLRLFGPNKVVRDIEPRADRVLIFLSAWIEHEVLPVFKPRFALTTWIG